MKTIRVVAAVICDSIKDKHKIYATARGYGDYKGGWEFPGGKIEEGETPKQAINQLSPVHGLLLGRGGGRSIDTERGRGCQMADEGYHGFCSMAACRHYDR